MNYIVTRNPDFFRKIGEYHYCSLSELQQKLEGVKGVSIDSETTGLRALDDKIFAVQIGTGRDNFVIDLQDYSSTIAFKEFEGITQTIDEVLPLLYNRGLVFHNAMFDLGFLMKAGFVPDVDMIYDTMIQSQILHNGRDMVRHNIGAVMERELGVKLDKIEQKNIHRVKLSTKEAIEYCFNDVDRLLELHKVMYAKLSSYGGNLTYHTNRKALAPLVYIELCGIPTNKYKYASKIERDKISLKKAEREVVDYIWENLPEYRKMQLDLFSVLQEVTCLLSSPSQMIPVFQKLGINTVTDDKKAGTKKGRLGETKEEKDLRLEGKKNSIEESVISLSDHEFVKLWLAYKDAQHKCNNFGANIYNEIRDGRIYVKFKPCVDTARISARKEGSMNSLNVPSDKDTRDCYEASEGFQFIVCDYEGQENVCLADQSLDPVMIASCVNNLDLHCAFARLAYPEIAELSDAEIKDKHKDKRTSVKSPRFLKAYGGSAYTMSKQCGMSMEQATFLSDKYDELHPGVLEWGNATLEKAITVGYLLSADNWRLWLPDFEEFKAAGRKIDGITREMWQMYKRGKEENILMREAEEKGLEYVMTEEGEDCWDVYKEWRGVVRYYWKKRGEYYRLSLNFPIQSRAAHQSKRALTALFQYIVAKGHLWVARIVNFPYDELDMEVKNHLVKEYVSVLENCMRECGDYYLESGLLKMGADAKAGTSWHTAK